VLTWSCSDLSFSGEDPDPRYYNDTIIYTIIEIPSDVYLTSVGVKASDPRSYLYGQVVFYVYQAGSIGDVFSSSDGGSISVHLIISFISWFASIFIIIKILHYFFIPI